MHICKYFTEPFETETKALILNNERDRLKLFIESCAYLYSI